MRQFFFARNFFRELVVGAVAFQGCFTHKPATFDAEVFLRDRKWIRAAYFLHLHVFDPLPPCHGKIRTGSRAQEIAVEAALFGDGRSSL